MVLRAAGVRLQSLQALRDLCPTTRCAPRLRPYAVQAGLGATCAPPTGASLGIKHGR